MKALLTKLKIKKIMISAYYLQTNDIIKHKHISIMQMLLKSYKN